MEGWHDAALSSCLEATRMWRKTVRASLERETLDQIEPGAVLGRKGELEAGPRAGGEPCFRLLEMCAEWLSRISLMAVSAG